MIVPHAHHFQDDCLDIIVTIDTILPAGMNHLHGCNIFQRISAVMSVLTECIGNQEMAKDQKEADEDNKDWNESS